MGGGAVESTLRDGADAKGLKLIETMGWDGAGYTLLPRHLARLAEGAQALGWGCDLAAVRAALASPASTPARIRLTLDREGRIEVITAPLPPRAEVWRLGLADQRLHSPDPWLTVKTTRRAAYDQARATMPPDLDEVILLNERGEVCDGSITTLFFDLGDGLCTPPRACGLLPGVLRAEMLATGRCREALLLARDLPHARLWLGNALRGFIPAIWQG